MQVREQFSPRLMAANGTETVGTARTEDRRGEPGSIGGFLASASGTISITSDGETVVGETPVTAGTYLAIPLSNMPVLVVTLASDAAGTLFAG